MTRTAPDRRAPGERLYRALMLAYPRAFRARYADDMIDFYRERMTRNRLSLSGQARIWFHLIPDLITTAAAERLTPLHRELDQAPNVARVYSRRREDTMSILFQDIRYALRNIVQRPGFTAVVVATLALGIGANTAIFTVVNAVLLRPLPFAQPERIVELEQAGISVSEPEFIDYQRGVTALDKLAAISENNTTITVGDNDPMRTQAARVSSDFFGALGVRPALGRVFAPEEFSHLAPGGKVVISHALWVQQFAADPAVLGKTLTVGPSKGTIIGVMPKEFDYPAGTALWTAWRLNPDSLWTRNNHYLRLVGKLAPGKSIAEARSQIGTLDRRWMTDFPETYNPKNPIKGDVRPIADALLGSTRPYLLALLGAVAFVLLIACVNVANLLLVRGESRRKEFAIRTALGASNARIVRQALTESMVLALFGAILGIGMAFMGVRGLRALAPSDLPRIDQVGVDLRVVVFATAITIITGALFGLIPALRVARGDTSQMLREGGKTSAAGASVVARRSLVIAEVALAVVMLSGAGLLIRSLFNLQSIDLGFESSHALTMYVTLPPRKYSDPAAVEYFRELTDRLSRLPGVRAAVAEWCLPIAGCDNGWSIMLDGKVLTQISESPDARPDDVTPNYFKTMGVRVLKGREFTENDRADAPPVAVINDAMAKKMWPGVDPIGHTLKMFSPTAPWVTIVGVVDNVRARGIQKDPPVAMYFPLSQAATSAYAMPRGMSIVIKTTSRPESIIASARAAVRSLDATVAVSNVATLDQVIGNSIASRRFTTVLLAGFAGLALLLAGVGIYGVIAYGVSERTYEIGVRMALGASGVGILRLVMREGAVMTAAGVVIGVAGAIALDRLLQSMLVGVNGTDALTFIATSLALGVVAALACALPARRAASVSPTDALRNS